MAMEKKLQVSIHPSIYTPHLHTLHPHSHLSLSSNQPNTPILPPRCDATGGTCIAT